MTKALLTLALALMVLDAVLAWVFVALYSRVRWWATMEGRHLMRFTIAVALMFSLSVLFMVLEPKPLVRGVIATVIFGWIAAELGNRTRLLLIARREVRAEAATRGKRV